MSSPFPMTDSSSTIIPDPSKFFSKNLLSKPLPTNSFFQNFVLNNGDQPEYFHPYLIKSSDSSLSVSYPSISISPSAISQVFTADLTITSATKTSNEKHVVSSFSDLGVTLDIPSSNLTFFLVRGSPFLTFFVADSTPLSITTIHSIRSFSSNDSFTKYTFKLDNDQTWILYSSLPIKLSHGLSKITSEAFSGVIRIALLTNSNSQNEEVLDMFSTCYPVSGDASFNEAFTMEYNWEKKGSSSDLLMLAHPLHIQLLQSNSTDHNVLVFDDFKYQSIDGDLVGVVGDSWLLETDPVYVTWLSTNGVKKESRDEIVSSLVKDVGSLDSLKITTKDSYSYGKLIGRAARFALIAEEVSYLDVIPKVKKFLKETIEPWLDGTLNGNGFLQDDKWGGIVTIQGSVDSNADSGFGIYNDHADHLGYFLYGIAVLTKIDTAWGEKYKSAAYSLMKDFMNLNSGPDSDDTRLRYYDLYHGHNHSPGLIQYKDGRNHKSTSQAANAYYSAALMGLAYNDADLFILGSTLLAFGIKAAQMWWHIKEGGKLYAEEFTKANRIMGFLWSNKRESGLWFAPPEYKECRVGVQLLPLLPISEVLFSDVEYVKQLVEWALPALKRDGVEEGWKGFVYALQGIYDKENALKNIRNLKGFDDGNSLTNLLWWIYSRE
ncbi:putative glucan endo-1,3-beta-D-glucosidase [Medicago truncatula]|uniref:glucan endo-1,3-beta-D-glucosidase n=1 Tax=Medicago truncatula TaxID=3880 RepID=G7ZYL1_MEDTR|nr:probable endo-1,3(4)-beta-glucanase ARB_01444 [Medicago truncatula]KEH25265.1 glycoside hydrolase family 81 protein [Medicago truncatula]RHN50360.1 putative glucan endo-1,3-beta-D-glucosidase [Medicago truncatula]